MYGFIYTSSLFGFKYRSFKPCTEDKLVRIEFYQRDNVKIVQKGFWDSGRFRVKNLESKVPKFLQKIGWRKNYYD